MLKNVLNADQESNVAEENASTKLPSINDIYDELNDLSFALKAFGTLLRTSTLLSFAEEDEGSLKPEIDMNKSNLRWGLSQILDLYLEKQEKILSDYADKYNKSDYVLLTGAEKSLKNCKNGMFATVDATINCLKKDIEDLDIVIARSVEFSERAQIAKKMIMDFIGQLKRRE